MIGDARTTGSIQPIRFLFKPSDDTGAEPPRTDRTSRTDTDLAMVRANSFAEAADTPELFGRIIGHFTTSFPEAEILGDGLRLEFAFAALSDPRRIKTAILPPLTPPEELGLDPHAPLTEQDVRRGAALPRDPENTSLSLIHFLLPDSGSDFSHPEVSFTGYPGQPTTALSHLALTTGGVVVLPSPSGVKIVDNRWLTGPEQMEYALGKFLNPAQ